MRGKSGGYNLFPMTPELQTLLTVGVPTIAVLIGILVNNSRLGDMDRHMNGRLGDMNSRIDDINARMSEMRSHFDGRIDELKETWRAELRRVEEVLDARLTNMEQRMAHIEERIG